MLVAQGVLFSNGPFLARSHFELVILGDDVCLAEEERIARGTGIRAGRDGPSAGNTETTENDNPTPIGVRLHWTIVDFPNSPSRLAL